MTTQRLEKVPGTRQELKTIIKPKSYTVAQSKSKSKQNRAKRSEELLSWVTSLLLISGDEEQHGVADVGGVVGDRPTTVGKNNHAINGMEN